MRKRGLQKKIVYRNHFGLLEFGIKVTHSRKYRLRLRRRYGAWVGFSVPAAEVIDDPSFEVEFRNKLFPPEGVALLPAAGESGIERFRIPMSDGTSVCVAETVPELHILNGRWKRPSRHEWIIEAHHQVRARHHLL